MLNISKLCKLILIIGITLLVPSIRYLTFTDEILAFALLFIALFDSIANWNWDKYKLLWIIIAIVTFYAWYSIEFLNYNTTRYILTDWVIELKPYIPFCVFFAIGPQFTELEKRYIQIACMINTAIVFFALLGGYYVTAAIISHPSYASQAAFISGIFYYYCSRDNATGFVSKRNTIISIIILCIGLISLKAKYFGVFIPSIYLLTLYKPGAFRKFSFKYAAVTATICATVLVATWSKIQYYFLTGNSDSFDPTVVQSYARPVLYLTGAQILAEHFPFGTGLASFASAPSVMNYSNVYFEYGIHNVHGISYRSEVSFVMDSFYPSIAQFGALGLILFICFWFYIYKYLRVIIRENDKLYRTQFIAGSMIIIFILVESIAATTFTHNSGMITMCLLGMSCAFGRRALEQQMSEATAASLSIQKI